MGHDEFKNFKTLKTKLKQARIDFNCDQSLVSNQPLTFEEKSKNKFYPKIVLTLVAILSYNSPSKNTFN